MFLCGKADSTVIGRLSIQVGKFAEVEKNPAQVGKAVLCGIGGETGDFLPGGLPAGHQADAETHPLLNGLRLTRESFGEMPGHDQGKLTVEQRERLQSGQGLIPLRGALR